MKRIAIVQNNKVINIIIGTDSYLQLLINKGFNAVEINENIQIGWNYQNNVFSPSESSPAELTVLITKKIEKAVFESDRVIKTFAAENVLMGITQAGKTKLIADTLANVMRYCQTGSLYEAINELNRIEITQEMSPFLTEDRKNKMVETLSSIISTL